MNFNEAQQKLSDISSKLYGSFGADSHHSTTIIRDYDRKPIGRIVTVEWYPTSIKNYKPDEIDSLLSELSNEAGEQLSMGGQDFTKTDMIDGKATIIKNIQSRFVSIYIPLFDKEYM